MRGSIDIVKFLLTQKIDINAQTLNFKDTALNLAVQEGHEEIVKLLLNAHADPNLKNCEIIKVSINGIHQKFMKIPFLLLLGGHLQNLFRF